MSVRSRSAKSAAPAAVRCAIYTRKSTEEGLEQEFNSLDAQREAAESFIASQRHEGWTCLPDHYDDGGFTGGNMERPALKRLLRDIEAGKLDVVAVYKVDRLSRSLLDFARMMQVFDAHNVSFVSVTQQFNTATSMGRLVLNVLLSFAQFERELISERTRDKIAATRRKGKWAGGHPILGYDVDPKGFKLIVHPAEAEQVRAIFELYRERLTLLGVVEELERRGWTNKRWITRKGRERGGQPFDRASLHRLLTNVAYVGKVKYKDDAFPGEHAAIVDTDLFDDVKRLLRRNGATGGAVVRNRFGAILKGVLRCAACQCAMTPSHTTRGGDRRYRYYVCSHAQKRGRRTCPAKSIPAGPIEEFVLRQIERIGQDPDLRREIVEQADRLDAQRLRELRTEASRLVGDLARWRDERTADPARRNLLDERIASAEDRAAAVDREIESLQNSQALATEDDEALRALRPIWNALTASEQALGIRLLVQRIDYHGDDGRVVITFHSSAIQAFSRHANSC